MKKVFYGIITVLAGIAVGVMGTQKLLLDPLRKNQENAEKFQMLFQMMDQWVRLKQEGVNLSRFFVENGYKKIAIYGMGLAGETLSNELRGTGVEVAYAIDRNKYGVATDLDVYSPDEDIPEVDAIIVSAIAYFDEVLTKLEGKMDCPIISLEDVVYNV